jgi:hypothetical protein
MSSRSDTRLYRGHRHRLREEIRLQCFRSTFGTVTGRATSCVIRQHCSMDAATSLSCRLGPQSGNVSVRADPCRTRMSLADPELTVAVAHLR